MSSIINGLVNSYQKNMEYNERLLSDLKQDQMAIQPPGDREQPVNHPAWAMSHMNIYLPVIQGVIKGELFEDPKDHKFGMNSQPETDGSLYPTRDEILSEWNAGHEKVCELLGNCDVSVFEQPVKLPRWAAIMATAGICLPYLMLNHENMHLGQISTWRRALGLARV